MPAPGKIQGLLDAAAAGVKTPPTLFLPDPGTETEPGSADLLPFLEGQPGSRFLIRSCVEAEDGSETSMAGHFASSGPLAGDQVEDQIPLWRQKNRERLKRLGRSGGAHLMVQPYLEADWGGVAFVPWTLAPAHALVDSTPGGAQQAVEGRGNTLSLISLRKEIPDMLPLPEGLHGLRTRLAETLARLVSTETPSLDVEWLATSAGDIVVVQVRPVTRPLYSPLPATEEQIATVARDLEALHPGRWDIGGFGESMGHLSLLSVSLFEHLFRDAQPALRGIGIRGGDLFFHRIPNGQVYRHAERENRFFRFRSITGPFRFGVREPEIRRLVSAWEPAENSEPFSYSRLLEVFTLWLAASLYFQHRERGWSSESLVFHPGEYELGWMQPEDPPGPAEPFATWERSRNRLKQGFGSELRKLKTGILRTPEVTVLDWETFRDALETDHSELAMARMTSVVTPACLARFPVSLGEGGGGVQEAMCVAGRQPVEAPCQVVEHPDSFRGALFDGHILVAPAFRNDWIAELPCLAGVVLEQGGTLSHSAIVARELDLPYVIGSHGVVDRFQTGEVVLLDPGTCQIEPVTGPSSV